VGVIHRPIPPERGVDGSRDTDKTPTTSIDLSWVFGRRGFVEKGIFRGLSYLSQGVLSWGLCR